jgi:hypothetical protein
MIVREKPDSFLLVKQHDHALASGEFARRWAKKPWPLASTLYAVANHDVAWRGPDASVRWNEEAGRPYSFTDYPSEPKIAAYTAGLDLLEAEDPYAACLCSMHYETLVRRFGNEDEHAFAEAESQRQERLKDTMSGEEIDSLERNLRFLKLCDGLSLFVCLNEPGKEDYPPPYPQGFVLDGQEFEPVWEDQSILRLRPNPFSEPFDLAIPYLLVGKDGREVERSILNLLVAC